MKRRYNDDNDITTFYGQEVNNPPKGQAIITMIKRENIKSTISYRQTKGEEF